MSRALATYISVFLFCVFLSFSHAHADQISRSAFFSAIPDLPIMSGLEELPDQTVMFDKAQGRIVESVAVIESQFENEIRVYYQETLPQLGWTRGDDGQYFRGNEVLQMNFERVEDERFLRVRVSPK